MKPIEYATIFKKNLWCRFKTIACTPTYTCPKNGHSAARCKLQFHNFKAHWESEVKPILKIINCKVMGWGDTIVISLSMLLRIPTVHCMLSLCPTPEIELGKITAAATLRFTCRSERVDIYALFSAITRTGRWTLICMGMTSFSNSFCNFSSENAKLENDFKRL